MFQKLLFVFIALLSFNSYSSCHHYNKYPLRTYKFVYLFMDIYNVSYLKTEKFDRMNISYLRNLKTKYTIQGWETGFKNIKNKKAREKALNWILSVNQDALLGDCFQIFRSEKEVKFIINGKLKGVATDKDIIENIFLPWFGKRPMGKRMKKFLLNQI